MTGHECTRLARDEHVHKSAAKTLVSAPARFPLQEPVEPRLPQVLPKRRWLCESRQPYLSNNRTLQEKRRSLDAVVVQGLRGGEPVASKRRPTRSALLANALDNILHALESCHRGSGAPLLVETIIGGFFSTRRARFPALFPVCHLLRVVRPEQVVCKFVVIEVSQIRLL